MKSTRLILVLLLSAVMVEHIYGKSYEDEADYFDLDDYEENSDDYLDFEPEDIEEELQRRIKGFVRPKLSKEQKEKRKEESGKNFRNSILSCYPQCGAFSPLGGSNSPQNSEESKRCVAECIRNKQAQEDIEEEGDFTSMHNRPPVYREKKTTPEEKAKKSKCIKECGAYFLKRGKEFEDGKTCFDSCMTTLIELAPSASTGARQVQQMPFQAARRVAARCRGKCNKIRIPENCEAICEKKVHSASSGGYNVEIDCANCIIDEKCGDECSPPNSSECTTCKNNIRI